MKFVFEIRLYYLSIEIQVESESRKFLKSEIRIAKKFCDSTFLFYWILDKFPRTLKYIQVAAILSYSTLWSHGLK